MKATVGFEAINDACKSKHCFYKNLFNSAVPGAGDTVLGTYPADFWLARITGPDKKYGFRRVFLRYKKDYKKSNREGTRGVTVWYIVESGYLYELKKRVSWRSYDRYFFTVSEEGKIIKVEDPPLWLKENLGKTS